MKLIFKIIFLLIILLCRAGLRLFAGTTEKIHPVVMNLEFFNNNNFGSNDFV